MTDQNYQDDIPIELARAAHAGTSFDPEKRGTQERDSYAASLAADLATLARFATTDEKRAILDAEFARYRAGYRQRTLKRLQAQSRCLSTMIAGPSKFPVARYAKASARADQATADLLEFHRRALAAIKRKLVDDGPIMAGDDDATAKLRAKLVKLEQRQESMKAANAAIRRHARAGSDAQIAALVALGHGPAAAASLLQPDFAGRIGFADYELKNNGAQIRDVRARLERVARAKVTPDTTAQGEHATIEDAPGDNRIRLIFPVKPDQATRARLKSAGFRWAPTIGAWQAHRNHGSLATARAVAGVAPTKEDQERADFHAHEIGACRAGCQWCGRTHWSDSFEECPAGPPTADAAEVVS